MNNLIDKLDSVKIQITDKFPQEDMEFCREQWQAYKAAFELYHALFMTADEVNVNLQALTDKTYVFQKLADNAAALRRINSRFISTICSYFAKKYSVSISEPEWTNIVENKYGRENSEKKLEIVPLDVILDNIFEQMGGMSFEDKAFEEMKSAAKKAVSFYDGGSKYIIKGVKLIIEDFYNSYKSRIFERYEASVYSEHKAFFQALTHFESSLFMINGSYRFLCGYDISEKNGDFDKHEIHSEVVRSIKVFKNGKLEVEFKDYVTARRFMDTYFPGLPPKEVAA